MIAASDGIAAAKAYMLVQPDLSFSETSISDPEAEIKRLEYQMVSSHVLRSQLLRRSKLG